MNSADTSNSNNRTTGATGMFLAHVKQVLLSLPPLSIAILVIPVTIYLVDAVLAILSSTQSTTSISEWIALDVNKVLQGWQVHRLVLYPFASSGFIYLLTAMLWLFGDLIKMENKKGTLKLGWIILTLFTLVPGIIYILVLSLLTYFSKVQHDYTNGIPYSGMTGLVVALILWSNLDDERNGVGQDRMLAGSIRISNRWMPALALLFFVFLIPANYMILNLACAVISYLYVNEKIPSQLLPSDATYSRFEGTSWLQPLTALPNFVTNDASGAYLPIFNPPSSATVNESSSLNPPPAPRPPQANSANRFPGQGNRLGG
ncbi:hypothetical protein K501DRAFT_283962 [Backusella circina FSU 941]|nr:hypothetical protein K501DRAFT_283962 [Backusella circina FSU 941]